MPPPRAFPPEAAVGGVLALVAVCAAALSWAARNHPPRPALSPACTPHLMPPDTYGNQAQVWHCLSTAPVNPPYSPPVHHP